MRLKQKHCYIRPANEGIDMKIHVWNAFASNNSGSYTIVGSFPSSEIAAEVAKELAELMVKHTEWVESSNARNTTQANASSPLAEFIKRHGLNSTGDSAYDWPEYGNNPEALAIDSQVIIHHNYTLTLPREFGEYFYSKGGRVDQELNHAHNPIVAICELNIPWQERKEQDVPAKISALLEDLFTPNGPFLKQTTTGKYRSAWRSGDGFIKPELTIGAVFDDLLAGFAAVNQVAKAHGFDTTTKISEAFDDSDPLHFLRPSNPPVKRGQQTLTLVDKGFAPAEVIKVIEQLLSINHKEARQILDAAPVVLLFDAFPEEVEEASKRLQKAGAKVKIKS